MSSAAGQDEASISHITLMTEAKKNRLANSKSPYLLQHATNPVDWYEWGPQAFGLAKERDVPIFLSVGYSACHWCHVLAHESFEDNQVANLMNEKFVNIKVDREERPDVDSFYMTFLQATAGSGGWPLSAFLTPSLQPFFAGTYFPKGRFIVLLDQISTLWAEKREDVLSSASDVMTQLRAVAARGSSASVEELDLEALTRNSTEKLYDELLSRYDSRYGGFSERGPKFPSPARSLNFLTAYARSSQLIDQLPGRIVEAGKYGNISKRQKAAEMAVRTLRGIWEGGIRDHVGGGVARYSVDERWHVPHFEKMLYDQAQLAYTSLSLAKLPTPILSVVSQDSSRVMLHDLAANILEYAERDLLNTRIGESGGFWSAEDADSKERYDLKNGEKVPIGSSFEGAFYVWKEQEIEDVLRKEQRVGAASAAEIFKRRYGVKPSGNVDPSSDIQGELTGKNVLFEAESISQLASRASVSEKQIEESLNRSLKLLYQWRNETRPRPHLDDKVVLGWNGLMISAYCLASITLPSDGSYPIQSRALGIAEDTAQFLIKNLLTEEADGSLTVSRTWRAGHRGPQAQADDHAFFIQGLLDLYRASAKESYITLAIRLQERQDALFWDEERDGYYTSVQDEHILLRQKDAQDGAEPSAASVTLSNLARLAHLDTSKMSQHMSRLEKAVASNKALIDRAPHALASFVAVLINCMAGYHQFIVMGSPSSPRVQAYIELINRFSPMGHILILVDPEKPPTLLAECNEVVKDLVSLMEAQGRETEESVRLCHGFACWLPVSSLEDVEKLMRKVYM